ncbi:M14 family zinc carboxypeptidase [Streptacidiphilus sp. MAP5-52]|uniref:M14 family zinc carboxypeptidase n=1 Tax=Streptacidiphilus sp. MAP5-52 TaxID=3156267 RepID=UPI003516A0E8
MATRIPAGVVMPDLDQTLNLAAKYTTDCGSGRVRDIGATRGGRRLELLSVGTGPVHLLVLGGPHSNEQVSAAAVPELLRLLGEGTDRGDRRLAPFTFHVLPVWDLDGAQLARSAFTWPPTLHGYHSGFFRPAAQDQPEWAFPTAGSGEFLPPETAAVAEVIDGIRPVALVSLHNADFAAGGYFMTTGATAPLLARLRELPPACGMAYGGPYDAPDAGALAPGVFAMPNPADGDGLASSLHYHARRTGGFGIIPEVPLWRITAPPAPSLDRWPAKLGALAERAQRAVSPLAGAVVALERRHPDCLVTRACRYLLESATTAALQCRELPAPGLLARRQQVWEAAWLTMIRLPLRLCATVLSLPNAHSCSHSLIDRDHDHALRTRAQLIGTINRIAGPELVPLHLSVRLQVAAVLAAAESAQEVYA